MELRKIADKLGIGAYPEGMESVQPVDICDEVRIAALQEEFDLFGEYYEEVLSEAQRVSKDPALRAGGEAVAGYAFQASVKDFKTTPFPLPESSVGFLPLLVQLPMVPVAVAAYRGRGFPEEMIHTLLSTYKGCMDVVYSKTGSRGLNRTYFNWLMLYSKALIFRYKGFQFEVRSFSDQAVILKNRETGKLVPLLLQGKIHKSGMILGAAGCEDATGSWTAEFLETEEGYYGYPAINGKVSRGKVFYPKEQWVCALQPGQFVLSAHLPKGMDISKENVDEAFNTVKEIANQWYPDFEITALYCGSWLLDPALADILGADSKIAAYGARFARYPLLSAGREVFNFVFPPNVTALEALPENTRLERGLKKLYLSGSYIHAFAGVIL